jgi:hypothetical protein
MFTLQQAKNVPNFLILKKRKEKKEIMIFFIRKLYCMEKTTGLA